MAFNPTFNERDFHSQIYFHMFIHKFVNGNKIATRGEYAYKNEANYLSNLVISMSYSQLTEPIRSA
jgi:hypothetical protein